MASFTWNHYTVDNVGDLVTVLGKIVDSGSEHDAASFMEVYAEHCDTPGIAYSNVGYCLGYLSHEKMVAGLKLFKTAHPVFGGAPSAESVTVEEAFEYGKAWAAASAEKISKERKS